MDNVILVGYITVPESELEEVKKALPTHIENTRNESGCIEFNVTQRITEPNRFDVFEQFTNEVAFAKHQSNVANSTWGALTKNVKRHYTKLKLSDLTGGCHCGKIRYQLTAYPFDGDFCHCRDCQKITGAPTSAWMDVKKSQLTWQQGNPSEYTSSQAIRRGFCTSCGSTLSYRSIEHDNYISLAITTLDNPNLMSPNYHIYGEQQVSWLQLTDSCKKYPQQRTV